MDILKRALVFTAVLSIIMSLVLTVGISAAADTSYSLSSGDNVVTLKIPSKFSVLTSDDIDKSVEFFKDYPVTKNEADKRFKSGVLLDAFSNDREREIRMSVFDAAEIGKYAATGTGTANSSSDSSQTDLIKGINNFSALSSADRQRVMTAICDNLSENGHIFLSTPCEITLSGYIFIKTFARIGSSTAGYTYSSIMTIIGGKCYELTCYDNSPNLVQEQIDSNEQVLSSLKLNIKGDSGEIAANNFQSFIAFAVILLAVIVIAGVVISFIKPYIAKRNENEQVIQRKK